MKFQNNKSMDKIFTYATLYAFANIENTESYKKSLLRVCKDNKILGTVLLAKEGVNGTISGAYERIERVIEYIQNWKEINNLEVKYSNSSQNGFYRMKVKVKKEIVTMGKPKIDPSKSAGEYIDPSEWNNLISNKDVIVIDTRNDYEVSIGKFKNAIDPCTKTFRDFPDWADKLSSAQNKQKKIAMYCTGGIRCEKATTYMKEKGFNKVYHLRGGILKYLETIPEEKSLWEGDCFVFDQRVSVKHNLKQGSFKQCYACKMPLSEKECLDKNYVKGISCPNCFDKLSQTQIKRFSQRQKQLDLSGIRGEDHIGQNTPSYKNFQRKSNN